MVSQVCGGVRLVSEIGVILEGQGEFAIAKLPSRHNSVVQPLEKIAEWEESLVEGEHDIRVHTRLEWSWYTFLFISCRTEPD